MHTYAEKLVAGDVILLPRDTRPLTLAADPEPVAPDRPLLRLTFLEDPERTAVMPAAADVTLVRPARTAITRAHRRDQALALMRRARRISARSAGR
ncbi:hypothetical protein AB0D90_03525 [Streptomyces althioticus]|uniref:hypothetical protein n=1 Tax=Streptomyces althioticus TaxID=83380 RepID=UPI0033DC44ED